jgi:polyisoprenoid-binding protein YceI
MSNSTVNLDVTGTGNLPVPGVYTIDPAHSTVGFVARHLVASKVRGRFTDFAGTITIGETPETSSVEAVVQAASITTDNEMRDGHLKGADFLDLENSPTLTFKSTKVSAKGHDFELAGDVTLRGITKPVAFSLEFLGSGPSMTPGVNITGFEARAEIDRRDFGVSFQGNLENGSLIVGNKIVLEFAIEAHQAL